MKSTTSVIIALGLLTSSAALAADNTGNAPGGTGIEQSTRMMGATNKQGDTSAAGQMQSGPNSTTKVAPASRVAPKARARLTNKPKTQRHPWVINLECQRVTHLAARASSRTRGRRFN